MRCYTIESKDIAYTNKKTFLAVDLQTHDLALDIKFLSFSFKKIFDSKNFFRSRSQNRTSLSFFCLFSPSDMLLYLLLISIFVCPTFSYLSVVGTPRVLSCSTTLLANVPSTVTRLVSTSNTTFLVGYVQIGINKNPVIARFVNKFYHLFVSNL